MGRPTHFAAIPAYLKSVTLLEPAGNVAAEVVGALSRMNSGTADMSKSEKPAVLGAFGATLALAGWLVFKPPTAPEPQPAPSGQTHARLPNPLQLRFNYQAAMSDHVQHDDTLRVNLQTRQRIVDGERLAQQASGFYSYNTAYPSAGEQVLGTLVREIRKSTLAQAPAPARFWLTRPDKLESFDEQCVHLDFRESGSCALHFCTCEHVGQG